jgi:hypothetical protein
MLQMEEAEKAPAWSSLRSPSTAVARLKARSQGRRRGACECVRTGVELADRMGCSRSQRLGILEPSGGREIRGSQGGSSNVICRNCLAVCLGDADSPEGSGAVDVREHPVTSHPHTLATHHTHNSAVAPWPRTRLRMMGKPGLEQVQNSASTNGRLHQPIVAWLNTPATGLPSWAC